MHVLFARHRTNIYRGLLRFVGNETVAISSLVSSCGVGDPGWPRLR
jgi:hypothetical protein